MSTNNKNRSYKVGNSIASITKQHRTYAYKSSRENTRRSYVDKYCKASITVDSEDNADNTNPVLLVSKLNKPYAVGRELLEAEAIVQDIYRADMTSFFKALYEKYSQATNSKVLEHYTLLDYDRAEKYKGDWSSSMDILVSYLTIVSSFDHVQECCPGLDSAWRLMMQGTSIKQLACAVITALSDKIELLNRSELVLNNLYLHIDVRVNLQTPFKPWLMSYSNAHEIFGTLSEIENNPSEFKPLIQSIEDSETDNVLKTLAEI